MDRRLNDCFYYDSSYFLFDLFVVEPTGMFVIDNKHLIKIGLWFDEHKQKQIEFLFCKLIAGHVWRSPQLRNSTQRKL